MQLVRRFRKPILVVLMLMGLAGMAYGYLQRVGIDPLRPAPAEEEAR